MLAVNLALQSGRTLQKGQTGFVHYCAQSEDEITHDTIPVLENALFALSLFRSRQAENVLEGKALLENLLKFEVQGTFPSYLHRYPHIDDPYLPLRLLPIFFWILTDFPHVLGNLRAPLQSCFERLLTYAHKHPLPSWGQLRLNAFEGKIEGSIEHWPETFISLQIAEKKGAHIEPLIQKGCSHWHPQLQVYTGPSKHRPTYKRGAVVTLYDLYMAQWQNHFSKRLLEPQPIHLFGALIRPLSFEPLFEQKAVPYIHFDKTESFPLWIGWEDHSLVMQAPRVEKEEDDYLIYLEEAEDFSFFIDYHCDHTLFVNGKKASAFRPNDSVQIRSKNLTLTLTISSDEGVYFGHILRGNRPHQHGCRGENKFTAYDWQITVRAVKKETAPIRVRLQLASQEQESLQPHPSHASHCQHTP